MFSNLLVYMSVIETHVKDTALYMDRGGNSVCFRPGATSYNTKHFGLCSVTQKLKLQYKYQHIERSRSLSWFCNCFQWLDFPECIVYPTMRFSYALCVIIYCASPCALSENSNILTLQMLIVIVFERNRDQICKICSWKVSASRRERAWFRS